MTVDSAGKGFTLPSGPTSLCFDKEDFKKKDFEVDKFIMDCRKKVPLEVLRDDLGLYLKVLSSAMIELINKDYADFVNLSTNLVGMDKAINNLTTPLGQLKEEVMSVQTAMNQAIQAVQGKIQQQLEIQRKKAVLHRLININNSVDKIEKLLGIQQSSSPSNVSSDLTGPLIERVATEFNKLQFYVTRSKGHPLVEKVKPRIAAITTTLQYSLEGTFLSGLDSGNAGMLRQCLRTYALIDKTHDAEDLFREHVVRPYMEEVINEDFLREHNNDTAEMYDEILAFIPMKCSLLIDITRGGSGGEVVRGYDFVVNAVFPEAVSGLESRVSSIFAPGNPDIFHSKYSTCMEFLAKVEEACGFLSSVKRLREHPSYTALVSRWSLPVYFQIRFQDIAGSFEQALNIGFNTPRDKSEFRLTATTSLWNGLMACWTDKVYLQSLCHKLFKLNVQLLARFKSWLNEVFQEEVSSRKNPSSENGKPTPSADKAAMSSHPSSSDLGQGDVRPRSASPKLKDTPRSSQGTPITIGQIVSLLADLDLLERKIPDLFESLIHPHLLSLGFSEVQSARDALNEGVQIICECRPEFWTLVTDDVVKRCSGFLSQVNDIPRLYRRTNKEVPSKPSAYLNHVMRPLNQFCEEHSTALTDAQKSQFLKHVFGSLAQTFSEVTTEVLTSTRKMEESLRRLKQARGGEKDKEKAGGMSDSDKIRKQIVLDIDSFTQQLCLWDTKSPQYHNKDSTMNTLATGIDVEASSMTSLKVNVSDVEGHTKLTELSSKARSEIESQ